MSAHTPEPWRWLNDSVLVGAHGRRPVVLMGEQLQQRGGNGLLQAFDPSSPDGRLIAAAPEMLAALKDIEFELSHRDDQCMDSAPEDRCAACRAMILARAAIAKAEGES
jgi:hypothetical protein